MSVKMVATTVQNPEVPTESKTQKKKRERAQAAAAAVAAPSNEVKTPDSANGDDSGESPYIKELYK